ncbi:MAG TPA: CHASE3 domain-containing protein, partial [Verrucomicrobiae bacterium]|nr:CHASE3 domain-containing protein [Verrucomicrobiae bacterium]
MNINGVFFRQFPRWVAGIVILAGALVIVSWFAHWQRILQLLPNTAPMQFNTALCFILCGTATCLLTTTRAKIALWPGAVVGILTALTLLEYVTGWDLRIDQFFFKPYFEAATMYPGRMSPLAAICFVFMGTGLVLSSLNLHRRIRLGLTGLLMCMVAVTAVVALCGFIFGIKSAYGWGAYSSMAVNTAMMFLLLSLGVLALAWRTAQQEEYDFSRWLPVTGSATLMVMVAFVAIGDMKGLRAATYWRKHTIQTILAAESIGNNLLDMQRGMRGFVTMGDTNGLAAFQNGTGRELQKLADLTALTRDNPTQQQNLVGLSAAVEKLFAYDDQLIELYRQQGSGPIFKLDATGKGRVYFGNVTTLLRAFSDAEQKLLDLRDASEETEYGSTERLLVLGCGLAAVLLLLANYMASRELDLRRRAEAKMAQQAEALRRSNAELEQFAYVASHDMREPLRAVSGFAQILKRDNQGKLDEKSMMTIGRIVDGAKRMANIIDDLLVLSSISSKKKIFQPDKLEKPLAFALENLSVAIAERKAVVRHDPLPELPVDSSQLVLL